MAKDIVAKVGSYTNQQNEQKGEFVKVGVILSNDNGEYILLDPGINLSGVLIKQRLDNPQKAGKMVMCGIYDRSQDQQAPQAPQAASPQADSSQGADDYADDIPF